MKAKVIKNAAEDAATKAPEVKTAVAEKAATDKTVEAKEAPKAEVKEAEAAAAKVAGKKAAKTTKAAAAKAAEKKEPAKKAAAAKTSTTKVVQKKAEVKANLTVQFEGKSYSQEELMKIAKDVWKYDLKKKVSDLKSVELYVKPEENTCYYVINDEIAGSFAL